MWRCQSRAGVAANEATVVDGAPVGQRQHPVVVGYPPRILQDAGGGHDSGAVAEKSPSAARERAAGLASRAMSKPGLSFAGLD